MNRTISGLTLAAMLLPLTPALAQEGTASFRSPTMAYASRLAAAAVQSCRSQGHNVVAVVVDRYGQVLTVMRDEAARPHAIEIATRKAYSSAMLGYDTRLLTTNIANGTTPATLTQVTGITSLIGGLPIKLGEEVVGGIGVSGGPGGPIDEACAIAALRAVPLTN
jgi:uncharacterized protein GlcG (DUF336 family)